VKNLKTRRKDIELKVPKTMKAAILVERNTLEVREAETPTPGPADVLIQVDSCAICGSDVSLMDHPWPGQPPYGELIPGHEYSGVVVGLGETVDEFDLGDRVYVINHINTVHRVPEQISLEEASLVTNAGCIVYGFESIGGLVAGETVVVIGTSGREGRSKS
jgi:L-iditol 2-dehydrogenase